MKARSRYHGVLALTLVAAGAALVPAPASAAGAGLVINEVYGAGGNTGANYNADFVELINTTTSDISLDGKSLQYRSASGIAAANGVATLSGTVPAGKTYLVQTSTASATNGAALPTPDLVVSGVNMAGSNGTVWLSEGTTALTLPTGSVTGATGVIDLVGFGTSNTYEGAGAAAAPSATTSTARTNGSDTDVNSADFAAGAQTPTPCNCADGTPPEPQPGVQSKTIAEIQGTGEASPLVDTTVKTTGVVTARYATGGFNGFTIQTPGATPGAASNGLFVYGSAATGAVSVGQHVAVTGKVTEYQGLTEITPTGASDVEVLPAAAAIVPAAVAWPKDAAGRESLESMLIAPQGPFTVSDNYDLNAYGEITLAAGTEPMRQPTDVGRPGSADALAQAKRNGEVAVTLDDGASRAFMTNAAAKNSPLPYLTDDSSIQVGNGVTFTKPVVVDYRHNLWRLQPTGDLVGGDPNGVLPVRFTGDTRTPAPRATGGDLTVASFNVLNYFTTTGEQLAGCNYYTDREGNPISVKDGCNARGAANAENLSRQQAKIVKAINSLDADVVSLEEIENSSKFGKSRDAALSTLVDALNAADATAGWAFVPSPSTLPASEDFIRTAFIYRKSAVRPVWQSRIYDGAEFAKARQPLAQVFEPTDGGTADRFILIVNHFKSKGSAPAAGTDPANEDSGQGAWNALRTEQAKGLVRFAESVKQSTGVDKVLLDGDFNSYGFEDPLEVLKSAGYVSLEKKYDAGSTYVFDGMVGSLDHAFANPAALGSVTGAAVWNINAVEAVAHEYSRYNYNVTNVFDPTTPYRSSDHDPIVFGMKVTGRAAPAELKTTITPAKVVVGQTRARVRVEVASNGASVSDGAVDIADGDRVLGSAQVVDGVATVTLPAFGSVGVQRLTATYSGSVPDGVRHFAIDVVKATPRMSVTHTRTIRAKRTNPWVLVSMAAPGQSVTGKVSVRANGRTWVKALSGQRARFNLGRFATPGSKRVVIRYLGSNRATPVSRVVTLRVVR